MIEKPKFFRGNIYKDKRGDLSEIYKKVNNVKFNFIIQSTSYKNVFRGLHFQRKFQQTKYIYLIKGKILDVVVDLRKNSKNFGKVYRYNLKPGCSLLIPKGYAHGYYTYGKENILLYIMDNYRKKKYEDGINVNCINLNIINKKKMLISEKDKNWGSILDFKKKYKGL